MSSLALSLARVHAYYLASLTSDHDERIFARDWPSNSRSLCEALRRVGRPAWFREGEADDDGTGAVVVASIDPRTGELRFRAASGRDQLGAADAARFDPRGHPLPCPGEDGPCAG